MRKNIILVLLLIFVTVLFVACSQKTDNEQVAQNAGKDPSDIQITMSIQSQFAEHGVPDAKKIEVVTENGLVTLRGAVSSEEEAERVIQLAQSVKDVRMVRSYLKSEPAGVFGEEYENAPANTAKSVGHSLEVGVEAIDKKATDAEITAAIKMRFAQDELLHGSGIEVDTTNGHVVLNGVVSSTEEADKAVQIARAVDHVKGVHSNLIVQ